MKKVVLVLSTAMLLVSCGEKRSVKQTAEQFLQCYYIDHDFEKALSLTTESSRENIGFFIMIFQASPFANVDRFENFEITSIDKQKTKAKVSYKLNDDRERCLILSKRNGKWWIDMTEQTTASQSLYSLSLNINRGGFASRESKPQSKITEQTKDSLLKDSL